MLAPQAAKYWASSPTTYIPGNLSLNAHNQVIADGWYLGTHRQMYQNGFDISLKHLENGFSNSLVLIINHQVSRPLKQRST
jgi:hypothetical protein